MNYNKERIEQDLYKCAIEHYTIEKLSHKDAGIDKEGNYGRFKTRYKDHLFIELSDKDLEKDKLALVEIIVKVRMKIDKVINDQRLEGHQRQIQEALKNYWIKDNCVMVRYGDRVYSERISKTELLKNLDFIKQIVLEKGIKENIEYDIICQD